MQTCSCLADLCITPKFGSISDLAQQYNRHFYDETKPFTCLDGSKTIPFDEVNDDYCDCKDGSDEPDCCDTTDEYNSGASCENTCKEQGRKEKETLQRMAEVAREGFRLKQQLIEEAKRSREEKQQMLTELQKKKGTWEVQVESLKAIKEAAEKPEQEAKEVHKKAWEEVQAARKAEREKAKAAETFKELDDNEDGFVSVNEIQTHAELDSDGDGVVSEPEAESLLGGLNQVDLSGFQESIWAGIRDKYKSEAAIESPPPAEVPAEEGAGSQPKSPQEEWRKDDHEEEEDGGGEDRDDDDDDEDDDEEDDDGGEEDYKDQQSSYFSERHEADDEKMPPYDDETQALINAADKARNEFTEAEKSLREVENSIGSLEKELTIDFGPDGEFAYMFNQCYEMTTNEYVYKLCPFSKVAQKPKHGGSETSLGVWGSWAGPESNKFSAMKYEHGTGCWQGPSRTTLVKLSCGKETVSTTNCEDWASGLNRLLEPDW
ncbi:hypothetical protein chiPu_0010310 [Chiloscyllium punctatum]|uniref:Glucosidase 2 subunit beta n=1 Tax=Chiloscyllium punctatum TaxID=137246 RepID=A0A401SN84_CHIPU|nr:hypothetical protein [Chiloscyllium punctatum]